MTRRVAVRAIIEHEGKLLAVQLKPYKGSTILEDPYWCTIGGGIDVGEALIPALQREVMEEVGVKADVGNLLYIQQFVHGDKEQLEFFFHVTNTQDFMSIDLSKASHAADEIEKIEFIDPTISNILPKFLQEENIAQAITTNQPTKIFTYLD
jgi:8-oxo-dGTP pyrophosphatase MutT (NUDIX family)